MPLTDTARTARHTSPSTPHVPAGLIPPPPASPQPPAAPAPAAPEIAKKIRRARSYRDTNGARREVAIIERDHRPTLVIDRIAETREDPMLVGEIGEAEDKDNPRLLAEMWMGVPLERRRCGPYTGTLPVAPPARRRATAARAASKSTGSSKPADLPNTEVATSERPKAPISISLNAGSHSYKLEAVAREMEDTSDLRWVCRRRGTQPKTVTLREVVAAVEAYQPAIAMCEREIANTPQLWHGQLERELNALASSRRVLNRGLREAVEHAIAGGTSLAEIAVRCGRIEISPQGSEKGQSSWVTRRIGMAGDGHGAARRWIDVDLLAQIAAAIGLTPADVEL